jgi:transposase
MMIIGCDFHPSWQQVSWLDTETGETGERKLVHAEGDAERFCRQVPAPALIGMEATATVTGWWICWPRSATSYGWAMRRLVERRSIGK